jgi:hypothetical protein
MLARARGRRDAITQTIRQSSAAQTVAYRGGENGAREPRCAGLCQGAEATAMIEQPRYEALCDVYVGGILYGAGAKFESWDWPVLHDTVPCNDAAAKIFVWWAKHHAAFNRPLSPRDRIHPGRIYLPQLLFQPERFSEHLPGLPDKDVTERTPRYKLKFGERVIGARRVAAVDGETFAYPGWPDDNFEPANEPAQRVLAYFVAFKGHASLPVCPLNYFDGDVFLPPLPAVEKSAEPEPASNLRQPPTTPDTWRGTGVYTSPSRLTKPRSRVPSRLPAPDDVA